MASAATAEAGGGREGVVREERGARPGWVLLACAESGLTDGETETRSAEAAVPVQETAHAARQG